MAEPSTPANASARKRSPRSRTRLAALLLAAAAIVLTVGLLVRHHLSGHVSTDDAQIDAHLYTVSARVPGYVAAVHVTDNQYVKEGDVLVELDPTDYEIAVARARAELANARATTRSLSLTVPITSASTSSQVASSAAELESADASISAAEEQAKAAHAQLEEALANDAHARQDVERYRMLAVKQEIPEQMYASAMTAARVSGANVAAARAGAAAADQATRQARQRKAQADAAHRTAQASLQEVSSIRARALAAEADERQKQAALAQAERNLGYAKILAPATGQVRKSVVVGLNVQPGQQLLTIVPLDDIWITANFKETQLRQIRTGQRAEIDVDSNGRTYSGHVDSLGAATGPIFSLLPPENATGNYVKVVQRLPVKIVLEPGENHDRQLRPGMNVVPTVYLR